MDKFAILKQAVKNTIDSSKELTPRSFVEEYLVEEPVYDVTQEQGTADNASLGGKDVGLFGDLSDDSVNNANINVANRASKISIVQQITSAWKDLGSSILQKIKKAVNDFHKAKKPQVDPEPEPSVPWVYPSSEPSSVPYEQADYTVSDADFTEPIALTQADIQSLSTTVELVRKTKGNQTIQVDKNGTHVKLTNSVDGKEYSYRIKSNSDSKVTVKLEYLDNDRLLIKANGITIDALEGQDDNLIIFGSDNIVNTNSGDDIVRVGYISDSNQYFMSSYGENYYDGKFKNNSMTLDSVFSNNQINTGSGNDYVQNFGQNIIHMGADEDYLVNGELSDPIFIAESAYDVEYTLDKLNTSDGELGWGMQGKYGDCKLLACLDSMAAQGKFKEYVQITETSTNTYTVTFPYSGETKTVTLSEIKADSKAAEGDLDFLLTEAAIRKLLAGVGYTMEDETGTKVLGNYTADKFLSKWIFGVEHGDDAGFELHEDYLSYAVEQYNAGNISQVIFSRGANASDTSALQKLGCYSGHAYALKGGVVGQYVLVTNPHDGKDIIKLDWQQFLSIFGWIITYGDTYEAFVARFFTQSGNEKIIPSLTNIIADINETKEQILNILPDDEDKGKSFELFS